MLKELALGVAGWSEIAQHLPGRTDVACRERYKNLHEKALQAKTLPSAISMAATSVQKKRKSEQAELSKLPPTMPSQSTISLPVSTAHATLMHGLQREGEREYEPKRSQFIGNDGKPFLSRLILEAVAKVGAGKWTLAVEEVRNLLNQAVEHDQQENLPVSSEEVAALLTQVNSRSIKGLWRKYASPEDIESYQNSIAHQKQFKSARKKKNSE